MPQVSVVLPTYNRAHLLKRSVNSVLEQTYRDFELIIIDDNSNDNTFDIVNSFGDERIKYIKHEVNRGPSEARNTGMAAAKGEYIAFQDSDDEWKANKLETLLNVMEQKGNEVGMVFSTIIRVLADGRKVRFPKRSTNIESRNILYEILKNNIVGTPAAMIRRECFEEIGGFDISFKCYEDYDYFIKIAKKYKIEHINEPLVIAHDTPGGVNSANYSIQLEMQKLLVERHYDDYKKDKLLLAERYFRIGDLYCRIKNFFEGFNYMQKAIRLKKNRPSYYIGLTLAFLSLHLGINIYKIIREPVEILRYIIKSI